VAEGIPYEVSDGDSWASLARQAGLDVWSLIRYNYPTLPLDNRQAALEVNWYLEQYVRCDKVTSDGKNYIFSSTVPKGVIYFPPPVFSHQVPGLSQAKENLCWYTCLKMVVAYYRQLGLGPSLKDPSEDPETQSMFEKNEGISDRERIARKLGFSVIYASLTEAGLCKLLKAGPVIYAGAWPGQLGGHWVVLVGMSGSMVVINDPYYGPKTWPYAVFKNSVLHQTAERPLIYVS
jgi:hypothetical protein